MLWTHGNLPHGIIDHGAMSVGSLQLFPASAQPIDTFPPPVTLALLLHQRDPVE